MHGDYTIKRFGQSERPRDDGVALDLGKDDGDLGQSQILILGIFQEPIKGWRRVTLEVSSDVVRDLQVVVYLVRLDNIDCRGSEGLLTDQQDLELGGITKNCTNYFVGQTAAVKKDGGCGEEGNAHLALTKKDTAFDNRVGAIQEGGQGQRTGKGRDVGKDHSARPGRN